MHAELPTPGLNAKITPQRSYFSFITRYKIMLNIYIWCREIPRYHVQYDIIMVYMCSLKWHCRHMHHRHMSWMYHDNITHQRIISVTMPNDKKAMVKQCCEPYPSGYRNTCFIHRVVFINSGKYRENLSNLVSKVSQGGGNMFVVLRFKS